MLHCFLHSFPYFFFFFSKREHEMRSRTGRRLGPFLGSVCRNNHPRPRSKAREQPLLCRVRLSGLFLPPPHPHSQMNEAQPLCYLPSVSGRRSCRWMDFEMNWRRLNEPFGCRRLDFTSCGLNSQKSVCEEHRLRWRRSVNAQCSPTANTLATMQNLLPLLIKRWQRCGFSFSLHLI